MDAHTALHRVFKEERVCEDCGHRLKQWNPDMRGYEYGCAIVENEFSKYPIPAEDCPGVEDEMGKWERGDEHTKPTND